MHEIPILYDIFVLFGLSLVALLFCSRLSLPPLVGFILTGVLSGPHALQLIENSESVSILAEIGIVFLLFMIGMEISLKRLLAIKRYFFIAGSVQVALTALGGFLFAQLLGRPIGESCFLGCLLSLSSTAIVFKLLTDSLQEQSPHGRVILAILIFQDVIAIPMMLLTPLFAGAVTLSIVPFIWAGLKGAGIILSLFFVATRLCPLLFAQVAKTNSREIFLLALLFVCAAITWVGTLVGLSPSLGAFLAGLILSDTEYHHQAIGDIFPLQMIFMSFFFISTGMLLDLRFLIAHPLLIGGVGLGIACLKAFSAGLATFALGLPIRTVLMVALSLFQVGELSFVLAQLGISEGLGTPFLFQLFLGVSLVMMALTPVVFQWVPRFLGATKRLRLPMRYLSGLNREEVSKGESNGNGGHVIIAGFGNNGRDLAACCKRMDIPYIILDMDAERIAEERARGEPILFGDASHAHVLRHAGIERAKVLLVSINDPIASREVVKSAKTINPELFIIVRTVHALSSQQLQKLGADLAISTEFEASMAIISAVMHTYHATEEEIIKFTDELRFTSS